MRQYDIRLRSRGSQGSLLFAVRRESDSEAEQHVMHLLERHPEYDAAEIWQGMRLLRSA